MAERTTQHRNATHAIRLHDEEGRSIPSHSRETLLRLSPKSSVQLPKELKLRMLESFRRVVSRRCLERHNRQVSISRQNRLDCSTSSSSGDRAGAGKLEDMFESNRGRFPRRGTRAKCSETSRWGNKGFIGMGVG